MTDQYCYLLIEEVDVIGVYRTLDGAERARAKYGYDNAHIEVCILED